MTAAAGYGNRNDVRLGTRWRSVVPGMPTSDWTLLRSGNWRINRMLSWAAWRPLVSAKQSMIACLHGPNFG